MTLDEIRAELPKGKWKHTLVFEMVDAAAERNLPLSAFLNWDPLDRAALIARNRVKASAQAYDAHLQEQESKKRRGKKKR